MLYLSTLLIEHKDVETFDEFLNIIKQIKRNKKTLKIKPIHWIREYQSWKTKKRKVNKTE